MKAIIKGADFSGLGLGNKRWSENYILNGNITNPTHKTAIRALYTTLNTAGIDKKLQVLRLFFTGTALGDKLNMLNPVDSAAAYVGLLVNDAEAAHTTTGYQPDATTSRRIQSEYLISSVGQLTNFHAHVFNNTPETSVSGFKTMLGVTSTSGGNTLEVMLSRNNNLKTQGSIGVSTTRVCETTTAYDNQKTGLLSIAKNGTTQKLYDAGVPIITATASPAIVVATPVPIQEGVSGTQSSWTTSAKLLAVAYGSSAWTDADEAILNSALVAFKAAVGA